MKYFASHIVKIAKLSDVFVKVIFPINYANYLKECTMSNEKY